MALSLFRGLPGLILALVLPAGIAAAAGPDRWSLHLGSYHVDAARDFEEFNPGVFVTWDEGLALSVGAYRNSYGELSVAGTVAYPVAERRDTRLSLLAGAAWYRNAEERFGTRFGNFVPLLGLRVEQGPVFVQAIAGDGGEATAILSFGLTFPFD